MQIRYLITKYDIQKLIRLQTALPPPYPHVSSIYALRLVLKKNFKPDTRQKSEYQSHPLTSFQARQKWTNKGREILLWKENWYPPCVKTVKKGDVKCLLIAMGHVNNQEIKAYHDPMCRFDEDAIYWRW